PCHAIEYEEKVVYKGCAANVTLRRCAGLCPSYTKPNLSTMTLDKECGCCVPQTYYNKEFKMPCQDPDDPEKPLFIEIIIFGDCICDYDRCTD
ncbi:hypothetical protein JD844_021944, partial [Phrynosoma platyrhinos]